MAMGLRILARIIARDLMERELAKVVSCEKAKNNE